MPAYTNEDEIDLENLRIVIRFVDRDFSRYTLFVPLFKFSKSFLGFENKFSRHLKINCKSKSFPIPKIANSVVSLVCCGIDRFARMDDEFRLETGIAKSLGFKNGFFTSSTAYRFFQSFTGHNINQLQRINLEILNEQKHLWLPDTGTVFVDIDMNTKSVEGKKIQKATLGYNRKSPGRLSLNWTVVHIAKVALYSKLHTGRTVGVSVFKKQINHVKKLFTKLNLGPNNPRFVYRIDCGYFSYENLKLINNNKFITRLPVSINPLRPFLNNNTIEYKKYGKHSKYYDFGSVPFPDSNTNFRIIVVKTYRKKKNKIVVKTYPLCTNLSDWKAKSVVKAYRGRQVLENCFRDTNQAFYSNKLPSSKYWGNEAFLWFVCYAYNIFFFFQMSFKNKKDRSTDTQKAISKILKKSRRDKILKNVAIT